jgi:PAS domain S-box-containing protein
LRRRRKDGSTFPIEINARWVRLEREYIITVVRDITEREQAAQRIREQAALLDLAHEAIIVRNVDDRRVTFWSKGAENLYGWTTAEAVGRDVGELVGIAPDRLDALQVKLLETGGWRGEHHHQTRAGQLLVVSTRATLVRDAEGAPKSILSINYDVTEQKALEARFLRAQRMESIGVLASGLAHDLGNILFPIAVCAPFLRRKVTPERLEEVISTIEMSAERGVQIVNQILTFGRGVDGERSPVQIDSLLKETANLLRGTFPKNIRIETSIEGSLLPVLGDATQLNQILLNLSVNARDAMPGGGRLRLRASHLEVDVGYASMLFDVQPGSYTMIEVSDDGPGIAPEIAEHMFEPFFSTKGFGQGTGLGLSTALGSVRSHAGFINVKTESGKGATFQICLPVAPIEATASGSPPSAPLPMGKGECILVVDDENYVRGAARLALESGGYRALLASDGAEAIGIFAANRAGIAAVITDLNMPHLDGPAFIRALRQLAPHIPIIVFTGMGDKVPRGELKAMEIEAILNKPFGTETLLRTLDKTLRR